jgi:predicted hydrocarbon binding protein
MSVTALSDNSFAAAQATRLPLSAAFLQALHGAAARDDGALAETLREAGYAAGQALFSQFAEWLTARGEATPDRLSDAGFPALFAEFLAADGWGTLTIEQIGESVLSLSSPDWIEAPVHLVPAPLQPSCHVTTGLWAGFLGRVADAPLAALEVECRASGAPLCRWLIASPDVLGYVYDAMDRGTDWDRAAASA